MEGGLFEKVYFQYYNSARKLAQTNSEWAAWNSWASGSVTLDAGLSLIPEFPALQDNLKTGKLILNLLIQPMITLYFRGLESKYSRTNEEKQEARKIAFVNVQTFLGLNDPDAIQIHLKLDKELMWASETESLQFKYFYVFHARYLECALQDKIVEWDALTFPLESQEKFVYACNRSRYCCLSPEGHLMAMSALVLAVNQMWSDFESVIEGKE